jgi:hypothetical protein
MHATIHPFRRSVASWPTADVAAGALDRRTDLPVATTAGERS